MNQLYLDRAFNMAQWMRHMALVLETRVQSPTVI